jgi:HD-like signal output (HDOD) protein
MAVPPSSLPKRKFSPEMSGIVAAAAEMSPAPAILAELGRLLTDVNLDLDGIAALVKQDAALAAVVLRIANSPFYGRPGLGSIEAAIGRLGYQELFKIVGYATAKVLVEGKLEFYTIDAELLREHMIATAVIAEVLADRAQLDSRHAYTSGLLRTVGMIVIDHLARSVLLPEDAYKVSDAGYTEWESRVMNLHFPVATAAIMKEWGFAKDVADAVRGHGIKGGGTFDGAILLHIALAIGSELGYSLPGERKAWTIDPAKLAVLHLDEELIAEVSEEARERVDDMLQSSTEGSEAESVDSSQLDDA